ncbi:NUDIX domain-containing protein [Agromyces sp. NPDC058064]|uniref:NUDIX domain-containing protein n=1 Tax=Agromyces sp. NPDC058064 TaxID=3346322 RepID=UPI0036D82A05
MTDHYTDAYASTHGRFTVVPAAYVLLRRGHEVLLQLRRGTGYYDEHWAFGAAGHVEAGESLLAGAAREAEEELGVSVEPGALELLTLMHRTDGSGRPIEQRFDVFFAVDEWAGEPRLLETQKAAALEWFSLDALPEPVVPHELRVLEALRDDRLEPVTLFGF